MWAEPKQVLGIETKPEKGQISESEGGGRTGEPLSGSEVDPYQEPCPDPHRALSEADQLTARRLGAAGQRQTDRKEGREQEEKKKSRTPPPRRSRWIPRGAE